ncbi:MAG: hypothetical protein GY862_01470 [Gammaproteobacteria bacterium]|nr:hypothetical protein [Gammaproteobacteria bacterium]
MALTAAERMRRYRARKAGGKTPDGKNLNKTVKLYVDEEAQGLIKRLQQRASHETLDQLFKRALLSLQQTRTLENRPVSPSEYADMKQTITRQQGKIALMESEYITPLRETVKNQQKKKLKLQAEIARLQTENAKLKSIVTRLQIRGK